MDIQDSSYPNPNGTPIFPGTRVTGPLIAGNVLQSDGTGNLAALGETSGQANVGYAVMAQSVRVTQAASTGASAGVYVSNIVVPAQSQIKDMALMVETAWTGNATTFGVGTTGNATALTAAGSGNASGLGPLSLTPGNVAGAITNWVNVGNTDVQIQLTSTNTGSGVGVLTVSYLQGINNQTT